MTNLLIVSENPEFRIEMRRAYQQTGCFLSEVRDGLAALQYAVESHPTEMILDKALSGLTAGDIRFRLSATGSTQAIKVRIMSIQDVRARATQNELAMTSAAPTMLRESG